MISQKAFLDAIILLTICRILSRVLAHTHHFDFLTLPTDGDTEHTELFLFFIPPCPSFVPLRQNFCFRFIKEGRIPQYSI